MTEVKENTPHAFKSVNKKGWLSFTVPIFMFYIVSRLKSVIL
jgi:hypothetical protein